MRHDLKTPRGAETINIGMNKYLATIRINGQTIRMALFADSQIHARLILQYQFGMNSVVASPSLITSESQDAPMLDDVIKTIKPLKPLNPAQARLASLKKQKDNLNTAISAERDRQRLVKTQQRNFKATH